MTDNKQMLDMLKQLSEENKTNEAETIIRDELRYQMKIKMKEELKKIHCDDHDHDFLSDESDLSCQNHQIQNLQHLQ